MKLFTVAVVCVLSVIAATAQAGITINSSGVYAWASAGSGSYASFNGTTIPTNTTLNQTDGLAYSDNAINWNVIGGQTVLSLTMNHGRSGTPYSYAQTYSYPLSFTANSSDPYQLSGFYNVTDVGATGRKVYLFAALYDVTTSFQLLFDNQQSSINTHNEQFVLGGTGDDGYDFVHGNLTGNLIAGHHYQYYTNVFMQNYSDADLGATAAGNLTLKIGTLGAVPEPTALFICSAMILLGVAVVRSGVLSKAK